MKSKIFITIISLAITIGAFLTVITSFNIGYGGLGETEDFFMDGGYGRKFCI